MSLHYLGKHEPRKFCLFSYAVYRVSKTKQLGEKQYLHTVLNSTTLLSTQKLLKLVDECREDIASQSSVVFQTQYTA